MIAGTVFPASSTPRRGSSRSRNAETCSFNATCGEVVLTPTLANAGTSPGKAVKKLVHCASVMPLPTEPAGTPNIVGSRSFTDETVEAPAGCTVPSTLTTNALSGEIYGDSAVSTRFYERLAPTEGTTLLTIPIEGCALAGKYQLKGVLYSRAVQNTGVEVENQEFISNEETSKFGGLTLAGNPAFATSNFIIQLVGTGTFKVQ